MDNEKKDFSNICNKDDEDLNNPCWKCNRFLFPIWCMIDEDNIELESQYLEGDLK